MPEFHIIHVYYTNGGNVITTVKDEIELKEFLIVFINNSFQRGCIETKTRAEKKEYMCHVLAMPLCTLIEEAIDVGSEIMSRQLGYGIVAVIEGGILRMGGG